MLCGVKQEVDGLDEPVLQRIGADFPYTEYKGARRVDRGL
jgi:hypothetical protein